MRALVVGASAGVGRALAEGLAARGYDLLLVASDQRDLDAEAAHLRLTHGVAVTAVAADAAMPEDCLDRIRSAAGAFGALDALFFPIGVSRSDDAGVLPLADAERLLNANLVTVVGVVGHFLPALLAANKGDIVGFGSVAAIRGRRSNIVYAAAKRGLESYFESLRHLVAPTGVRVQFYRLGYIETQQSFGKRLPFPPAPAQRIAETVIRNLGRDLGRTYLPRYWSLIGRAVSVLPWPIFKRLDF